MEAQTIFDTVCTHLYAQKKPAFVFEGVNNRPVCAYRGDNGTSCAVGCLIPDEEYYDGMEGSGVTTLFNGSLSAERLHHSKRPVMTALSKHVSLLSDLQDAHDTNLFNADTQTVVASDRFDFRKLRWTLFEVARKHELDTTVLRGLKA